MAALACDPALRPRVFVGHPHAHASPTCPIAIAARRGRPMALWRVLPGLRCRAPRALATAVGSVPVDISVDDESPGRFFPYLDNFTVGPHHMTAREVLGRAEQFVSRERLARFHAVASERCFSVVPVLEGLHDVGNIAAVARSADALGFGRLHVIQGNGKYKRSHRSVSAGSDKWIHMGVAEDTREAFEALRRVGYRVAVTHLGPGTVDVRDMDFSIPTAVVLGNEKDGVSPEAVEHADVRCAIPMVGFVDSFNVSVAASLVMWTARQDRAARLGMAGDLGPEEAEVLAAAFALRHHARVGSWIAETASRARPAFRRRRLAGGGAEEDGGGEWEGDEGAEELLRDLAASAGLRQGGGRGW